MPKNYYLILGIPSSSSQEDIKAAYRRLAKEFHPDYYGKNQAPFQVLQEAYSVLSDPRSRSSYDETLLDSESRQQSRHAEPFRRHFQETVEPLVPDGGARHTLFRNTPEKSFHHYGSNLDSMFDEILGRFSERPLQENRQYDHNQIDIELSPEQARRGGNVRLLVPFQMHCPSCHRYGNFRYQLCRRCHGRGFLSGGKNRLAQLPSRHQGKSYKPALSVFIHLRKNLTDGCLQGNLNNCPRSGDDMTAWGLFSGHPAAKCSAFVGIEWII